MEERDLSGNLPKTWFYDEVVEKVEREFLQDSSEEKRCKAELRRLKRIKRKTKGIGHRDASTQQHANVLEEEIERLELMVRLTDTRNGFAKREVTDLANQRVIRIGPSTLDSLMQVEPDRFDYVEKGHLPFPFIFFDFPYPPTMEIIGSERELPLGGISFFRNDDYDPLIPDGSSYNMNLYFKDGGKIRNVSVGFDPVRRNVYSVNFHTTGVTYDFNMDKKVITETDDLKDIDKMPKEGADILIASEKLFPRDPDFEISLEGVPNSDMFLQIGNLCVNLINYINAENITVRRRTREVGPPRKKGKKKKRQRSEFYVIDITSKEVMESTTRESSWELTERVFVRGHNRRYRNNDGRIYRTTWIHPHIKGPPDAPFRNNRYRYMAQLLDLERRLNEE